MLGVLLRHGMALQEDLSKTINLHKGSTRYTFKENDPRILVAEGFLKATLRDMRAGSWKHYRYPEPREGKKQSKKRKKPASEDEPLSDASLPLPAD